MKISLKNKHALVCGSSKGIGKAIAVSLSECGASVTLLSRNESVLKETLSLLNQSENQQHHYIVADMNDQENFSKTMKNWISNYDHDYSILINNSGGPTPGLIESANPEEFLNAFNRHIITAQILTQLVLPGMKSSNFGRIINIISTSVKIPIPELGVSNTIRAAMANWSKTYANEVGKYGITVNNILPGFIQTERLEEILQMRAAKTGTQLDDIISESKQSIPAGRFGKPSELGYLVAFLCSTFGDYINGTNITIDGGKTGSL